MSEQAPLVDGADCVSVESRHVIHDLRAQLILAIAYLDELRICREGVLHKLRTGKGDIQSSTDREQLIHELGNEMGMCIDMIGDSLEELDGMMPDLRKRLK